MRASTRRRITIALVGLLVLVLIGWLVQDAVAGVGEDRPSNRTIDRISDRQTLMDADELTATAVANDARARGARTHIVDGTTASDRDSTLDAIAGALSFPGAVPRTMDELYDRLTDLSWLVAGEHVLIWVGSDSLKRADPKAYLSIRGVLSDSQRALAAGDGRPEGHVLTVALTEQH